MKIPKDIYNKEQLEALKKNNVHLDFSKDYSDDEIVDIEDLLADIMLDEGFTNGEPNKNCVFWETIFDTWQDVMDSA